MKIKQNVQKVIDNFDLTDYAKKRVEKVVARYSTPKGFCETLKFVCHKVKNFFLFFVGYSDWQRSIRASRNFLINKVNADLKPSCTRKEIDDLLTELVPIVEENDRINLKALIKLQNGQCIKTEQSQLDDFDQKIRKTFDRHGIYI